MQCWLRMRTLKSTVAYFRLNYLGVYHTVKACLPDMVARRRGHVLFMGSLMAVYGAQHAAAHACAPVADMLMSQEDLRAASYCAAKGAVKGLADSLQARGGGARNLLNGKVPPNATDHGSCAAVGLRSGGVNCAARPGGHAHLHIRGRDNPKSVSMPGLAAARAQQHGSHLLDKQQCLQPALAKQMLQELRSTAVPAAQVISQLLDAATMLVASWLPPFLSRSQLTRCICSWASPVSQVAKLALDAVQTGRYIAKATSFGIALATAPSATVHPRLLPVALELLLAPVFILVPYLMGGSLSKRIVQWRHGRQAGK